MRNAQSQPLGDSALLESAPEHASDSRPGKPCDALCKMRWAVVVMLCVLPAIIALIYIHSYGVNGVFWDEFGIASLFEKHYDGTLTFQELYKQHNEHRLLFPRLVLLPLGLATRFNTVAEMYAGWGFLCLSGLPILLCCRRMYADALTACVAFVPVSWMLFNLRQSENLLWGMQMLFFMSTALFLLSIHFLSKAQCLDRWLIAATAIAIIATFSFSSMLMIWPVGLALILMNPLFRPEARRRELLTVLCFWGTTGIIVWLVYFVDYTSPPNHPSLLHGVAHPLELLRYVGLYLGSPLGRGIPFRAVTGSVLLAAYVGCVGLAWRRWRMRNPLPVLPIAMILVTLGSALVTAVARVGFGSGQALAPRYVTFGSLGLIGLYLVILELRPKLRVRIGKRDMSQIIGGLVLLLMVYPMYDKEEGVQTYAHRSRMAYYLRTFELQNDNTLSQVYEDADRTRRCAEFLKHYKLNVFAEEPVQISSLKRHTEMNAQYAIDVINDELVAGNLGAIQIPAQADTITTTGWARDGTADRPAGAVFAEINGEMNIPGLYGLPRRDVAEHFKSRFHRYGFEVTFSKSLLAQGRHSLRLKIVSADKTRYAVTETPVILELR